jgi:putative NADH-flavin reductase
MKITLFGATGKTGPYLIEEGLRRGFEIQVFAHSGRSFERSDVSVVRGDFADMNRMQEAIRGSTAVLSALGPTRFSHPGNLPITHATEAIITAMKRERVSRLIAVSTGSAPDPGDGFALKIWLPAFLIKLAMPAAFKDIIGLASAVRASGLSWTLVRSVGVLNNRPASGQLNIGPCGRSKHSLKLSREDLARFMFDQIADHHYSEQAPGISCC